MKPRIVLSAVNFVEGGPLSLFSDALRELAHSFADQYTITALVHDKSLFNIDGIEYLEFPHVKQSWLRRLRFEYVTCKKLSHTLDAHLWLAMHDITPRVTANIRAVYCHNPAPFYRLTLREALVDRTFTLFCLLYRFLYGIGIRQNNWVIVQQEWLRSEFRSRYGARHVIVAHPSIHNIIAPQPPAAPLAPRIFFYPLLARSFKNVETILLATELLEQGDAVLPFELWLTISGTENTYAKKLRQRFGHLHSVQWMGRIPREEVAERYARAGCLVFPSRLETWGMPISEWKPTGKPMLLADLPYAHETAGTYGNVSFFPPTDATKLASLMREFLSGTLHATPTTASTIAQPFADDWKELFDLLLQPRQD